MSAAENGTTGEGITVLIHWALKRFLTQRMAEDGTVLASLKGDCLFFRVTEPRNVTRETLEALGATRTLRMIASLPQIFARTALHATALGLPRGWAPVEMSFASALALRCAHRLLEQLGQDCSDLIDTGAIPATIHRTAASGHRSARLSRAAADACLRSIKKNAACVPGPHRWNGEDRRTVRFRALEREGEKDFAIEYLDGDVAPVGETSLRTFVHSIARVPAEQLARESARLRKMHQTLQGQADEILGAVCPVLAYATRRIAPSPNPKPIALHVGGGEDRHHVPMDVWLYLRTDVMAIHPSVELIVYRPHAEFVLQAREGGLYYFPPCQLGARIQFAGPKVTLGAPIIRQSEGGFTWNHPYSGPLSPATYCGAKYLGPDREPVVPDPSPEAKGLFEALASRSRPALDNDMCLSGQGEALAVIETRLNRQIAFGKPTDMLSAVGDMHRILRLGLTRGHQANTSRPRASLGDRAMPYPLGPGPVPARLRARLFPYDPREVVRA